MSYSDLGSLFLFCFLMTATPGPNNIMLAASGVNFGYRRTIPHLLGIVSGVMLLNIGVMLGLGYFFNRYEWLQTVLSVAGSGYLLWLAYRMLGSRSGNKQQQIEEPEPVTFSGALLFQWANPKAWLMVTTAFSVFAVPGSEMLQSCTLIIGCFLLVSFPSCSVWALAGDRLRPLLNQPVRMRWFNRVMAAATASCVLMII